MTFAQPFKDYEILDRIGSGAMGTVFRARHKSLNRIVALKVLRPSLARDQRYVNRLSREARIVAAFNHPNIVAGYDLGQEGGYHFFVMELVEGKSLRELLSEWGSFPEAQVLDTAIKVTSALDHAYKKGVIHRDIKPGNILIDAHNTVKLTDMGLAKGPADLTITREGATVGTPQYISPEQARDPQNVDVRSDLYSLGATLFHMCTGQPPFRAETIANVIFKVINERAPSAREINPEVSEELSLVIRKLMAKDPNLRYQTPEELLADLHRVQRAEQPDVNLRQLEALDQVGGRGRRWAMVALGVAGLAALVVVLVVNASGWRDNNGSQEAGVRQVGLEDAYRRDLQKDLDTAGWRAKLAALTSRDVVANDWQQAILRSARAKLEQHLRSELDGFLARQDVPLRQWILDWGTQDRFFKVELQEQLVERFGLRPAELPHNLRGFYDQGVAQLAAKVPTFENERNEAYLTRLDHCHQNLNVIVPEYQQRLQDDNFYGAEQALREALRSFRRDDPPVAEMPTELREEADRRQTTVLSRELDRIRGEEQRIAQKLRSSAEVVVSQVRQLLRTDAQRPTIDPREADRLLDTARKRLVAAFPPEHFRSESSPWPGVEDELDAAVREVQLASTTYERELKRLALRDALRIAVADGRAGDASSYLDGRVVKVGEQQLGQYITLWQHAENAHQALLKRILDRNGPRIKVEKLLDRTEAPVVLRKEHDRLVMKDRNKTVSLAAVSLRPLEQLAGGQDFRTQLTADERIGLAAWYVLSGDYAAVYRLIPKGAQSEFLFQDLKPMSEQLRQEELGPQMAATRLLENAHKALKEGDWQKALDTVHEMHQQHPAFYQSHLAEQERIKHEAEDGRNRTRKLAALKAEVPPGAKVSMQGWRVSAEYPLANVDLRMERGWQRSGGENGGVSFLDPTPTLGTALQSALVLKSPLAEDDSDQVTVQIVLSFPEQAETLRLVLLRCCGVGVVLGLVRGGGVVAKGVRVSELSDAKRLHKQLQPGLRAAAAGGLRTIVPEALHQLKVVVQRHGRRLRGTVYLDGDPTPLIPAFDASGRLVPELAVVAMHPLTVHSVYFEGEVRRDG